VEAFLLSESSIDISISGSKLVACLATKKADSNMAKVRNYCLETVFHLLALQVKKILLDILTKTILLSKIKVSEFSVKQLSPFLRLLTHNELKSLLLLVMTKAILRCPEVALSMVRILC
jgi:hypothetical protein